MTFKRAVYLWSACILLLFAMATCYVSTPEVTPTESPSATPSAEVLVSPEVEVEVAPEWAYPMTWEQFNYVARVVMSESGNQTIEGQMAVAQCIANTASATSTSPYEVVTVPKQYAAPWPSATESVIEACVRVFRDDEKVVVENIRWFYNPSNGRSSWHESKQFATEIGAHKFFMELSA